MISNGIDLINIDRFKNLINNPTFLNNNFTNNELDYIKKANQNILTMAGIYASKEALLKALKKGINDYSLKDIEILHTDNSAPYINLHNNIKKDIDFKNISLSISHDGNYAIAMILILF